ncbi:hypothetical protein [Streptomyces sp. NPDC086182]
MVEARAVIKKKKKKKRSVMIEVSDVINTDASPYRHHRSLS